MRRVATGQRAADNGRGGFTLVELLIVIVVLSILIALLLPAINSALRTARNAAVLAEINQLAQALESFKSEYGDYPPSRVLLVEHGDYTQYLGGANTSTSLSTIDSNSPGTGDITVAQLASRSLTALRRFWPKVQFSTNGSPPSNINKGYWYDFNGNGTLDGAYILHGHECLVFFLGGIPLYDASSGGYGMTGFGNDPANPFSNSIVGNPMYNPNRRQAYFEFNAGRLFLDPSNLTLGGPNGVNPGIPGYYDSLNTGPPTALGPPPTGAGPVNFYAYFSAYGRGNYDPNDVNFVETDAVTGTGITGMQYNVGFLTFGSTATPYVSLSPGPNPYTTTLTAQTTSGTITYQKPQSYQLISSGGDGLYGVGGQYQQQQAQTNGVPLPLDTVHTVNVANGTALGDGTIRQREYDNLTNFKSGRLE